MTSADKVFKEMEMDSRSLQGQEKEGDSDLKWTQCRLHSVLTWDLTCHTVLPANCNDPCKVASPTDLYTPVYLGLLLAGGSAGDHLCYRYHYRPTVFFWLCQVKTLAVQPAKKQPKPCQHPLDPHFRALLLVSALSWLTIIAVSTSAVDITLK